MSRYIAQVNIAHMKASLQSPIMADFVARIDEMNALADRSPGFIWRLLTDSGNALYIRPYEDQRILFNLSVWRTIEDLRGYVYHSAHIELIRTRAKWFESHQHSQIALWWIPADHRPTVEEAKKRLEHLACHGPSPSAFTFKTTSPAERP